MDGDEDAQVSAPAQMDRDTPTPAAWLLRGGSTLVAAAVSATIWEIGTSLRLARLATRVAVSAPGDLLGRAGRMVDRLGQAAPNLPEEANRALVLRLYRAAVQGDLPTVRKLLDEDVGWHVPGPETPAGRYRGIAETVPALAAIWRRIGTVEAVELRDVVASRERAATLLRLSVVRSGRRSVLDWWLMFRIDRGRVTQAWGPFSTEPRL